MKKQNEKIRIAGWSGIVAALIIFFNPDIAIIDIMPDFIGYIILCAALSRLADIDDRINEAHVLFNRMIYIALIKFVALPMVFGLIPTTDTSTTLLICVFAFSTLEMFILIPAAVKLFDGIIYLSSRHGGEAAYAQSLRTIKQEGRRARRIAAHEKNRAQKTSARPKNMQSGGAAREKYKKSITEKLRDFTIFFIIIKAVCSALPEFAVLAEHTYDETSFNNLYEFVGLLRTFAAAVALVVGIIWLSRVLRYVRLLKRDIEWIDRLSAKYESEILARPDLPARRAIKLAFGFFVAAAFLSLDFAMDGFNILPDIICAFCVIAGLLTIKKYISGWRRCTAAAVVYGMISGITTYYKYWFDTNFYPEAIYRSEETYSAYLLVSWLSIFEAAAFVLMFSLLFFIIIKNIILKHTGFSMTTVDSYDPSEKIRQLHVALITKLYLPMTLTVMVGVATASTRFWIDISFLWLIEFLLTAIFALSVRSLVANVSEQIDYKYMLS